MLHASADGTQLEIDGSAAMSPLLKAAFDHIAVEEAERKQLPPPAPTGTEFAALPRVEISEAAAPATRAAEKVRLSIIMVCSS
jgi:hypothetical protein